MARLRGAIATGSAAAARRSVAFGKSVYRQLWVGLSYLWPQHKDLCTNNLGFFPPNPEIASQFPIQKHQIQLYAELLKTAGCSSDNLAQRAVLEVGAGRGGGLLYIAAVARPRWLIGIDSSFTAAYRGRRRGLDLRRASAEQLPFADDTFDRVICIETLSGVLDQLRVLRQMARVLAPNGLLLLGEFRIATLDETRDYLARGAALAGLEITEFRDATANVHRSIKEDHARNLGFLESIPKPFRRFARERLMIEGSARYRGWEEGAYCFCLAALTKRPAG